MLLSDTAIDSRCKFSKVIEFLRSPRGLISSKLFLNSRRGRGILDAVVRELRRRTGLSDAAHCSTRSLSASALCRPPSGGQVLTACTSAGGVRLLFLRARLGRRAGRAGRGRSGASLEDPPFPEASVLGLRPLRLHLQLRRAWAPGERLPEELEARGLRLHQYAIPATPEQQTRVEVESSYPKASRTGAGLGLRAALYSFFRQLALAGWF